MKRRQPWTTPSRAGKCVPGRSEIDGPARWTDRTLPTALAGRLRLSAADEPRARAARLEAGRPRLPTLGFTNATAFSPTEVMPLTHRAKYIMILQSTVSLALFGLIVARAVNAFT